MCRNRNLHCFICLRKLYHVYPLALMAYKLNMFNFLHVGLILNYHLDWKSYLNSIGIKVARVNGLLRKLKYTFSIQVLQSIYNSLILPHNYALYALLVWEKKCHKIELLQKKALRIIFSKSAIAHTEPLLKK